MQYEGLASTVRLGSFLNFVVAVKELCACVLGSVQLLQTHGILQARIEYFFFKSAW